VKLAAFVGVIVNVTLFATWLIDKIVRFSYVHPVLSYIFTTSPATNHSTVSKKYVATDAGEIISATLKTQKAFTHTSHSRIPSDQESVSVSTITQKALDT